MIKNILSAIGVLAVLAALIGYVTIGTKVSQLHPDAMGYYMDMFNKVLETGSSADAMVRKVKIKDDISTEDVIETLKETAAENNFLVVGDSKMSVSGGIKKNGKRYIRILHFCSPSVAEKFIAYSQAFGAFMPCRILIVEDDEGNRWLYTMSMELMLYGGKPLPPEMMKMAETVRNLMYGMMDAAATGEDYEAPEDE
ncbi:MAG: DUF302 domain-containing protein [Sulfurospirillum sp.]|nr:MAG: DUF302 domain-containing protein [Sulfurospirillum sp.]